MRATLKILLSLSLGAGLTGTAWADSFSFSTEAPDGLTAPGSRPSASGVLEIESADDFILPTDTSINHATFYGLITTGLSVSDITQVRAEIHRVFPKDSSDPPSGNVPTRMNSSSDVAFQERDSAASELTFSASVVSGSFDAANSSEWNSPLSRRAHGGQGGGYRNGSLIGCDTDNAIRSPGRSLLFHSPGCPKQRRFLVAIRSQANAPAI